MVKEGVKGMLDVCKGTRVEVFVMWHDVLMFRQGLGVLNYLGVKE